MISIKLHLLVRSAHLTHPSFLCLFLFLFLFYSLNTFLFLSALNDLSKILSYRRRKKRRFFSPNISIIYTNRAIAKQKKMWNWFWARKRKFLRYLKCIIGEKWKRKNLCRSFFFLASVLSDRLRNWRCCFGVKLSPICALLLFVEACFLVAG